MKRSVADFFGVGEENPEEQKKWFNRSVKLASRNSLGGKVKPELQRATTEDRYSSNKEMPFNIHSLYDYLLLEALH